MKFTKRLWLYIYKIYPNYIPVPEPNQATNFHAKYLNSYINCQVPTVAVLLIRPNSWRLKSFTRVNSFPLCNRAPLLPVSLSVIRSKSLFHQASVAFLFLSLLVTPKKSILLQWAKHFYLSQNSFPNYLLFQATVSVHSSISSAVSEETCVGDTFSELSMAVVNALLRREFRRSKPHGVHEGLDYNFLIFFHVHLSKMNFICRGASQFSSIISDIWSISQTSLVFN